MRLSGISEPPSRGTAAQSNVGVLYAEGRGVPQDHAKAEFWYRKAADQGQPTAECNLGEMYARGQGVPQDYVEAAQWYRKAAEQRQSLAQSNLCELYASCLGVAQDLVEAHKWMELAATDSSEEADQKQFADRWDALVKKVSPSQIAEAERRAREWTDAFEKRQKVIVYRF